MTPLPVIARSAEGEYCVVPVFWRRRRQRLVELDAAVVEATRQREISEQRLQRMRTDIVHPLAAKGARNQFADYIRSTLHHRLEE